MSAAAVNPALDPVIGEYAPGEEIVAAEMFQRAGTWAGTGGGGFLGKLFGRGEEGPPGPEKFNALILTRDRLHLVGVKPKGGAWAATKPVGTWDLGDIGARANQEHVQRRSGSSGDFRGSVDVIQLSIDVKSEGRTLHLEGTLWGDQSKAQETADALLAAVE